MATMEQIVNENGMVTLPTDLLKDLYLRPGDKLYITKLENGGLIVTPYNPNLANLIDLYETMALQV